jgi:hypothetical protein
MLTKWWIEKQRREAEIGEIQKYAGTQNSWKASTVALG